MLSSLCVVKLACINKRSIQFMCVGACALHSVRKEVKPMVARNVRPFQYDAHVIPQGQLSHMQDVLRKDGGQPMLRVLGVTISCVPEPTDPTDVIKRGVEVITQQWVYDALNQQARIDVAFALVNFFEEHDITVDRDALTRLITDSQEADRILEEAKQVAKARDEETRKGARLGASQIELSDSEEK